MTNPRNASTTTAVTEVPPSAAGGGLMTDWRDRAACADIGTDLFYPASKVPERIAAQVARAKEVCQDCPVIDECLAYIMATEQPTRRHGIWAGLTPEERTALARKRKRA